MRLLDDVEGISGGFDRASRGADDVLERLRTHSDNSKPAKSLQQVKRHAKVNKGATRDSETFADFVFRCAAAGGE